MNTNPRITAQFSAKHDVFGAFAVHRSISGYALWTPICTFSAIRRHSITQSSTRRQSRGPATDERMNYSMFSARYVPQGRSRVRAADVRPRTQQIPRPSSYQVPGLHRNRSRCRGVSLWGELSRGDDSSRKASDPAPGLCRLKACRPVTDTEASWRMRWLVVVPLEAFHWNY